MVGGSASAASFDALDDEFFGLDCNGTRLTPCTTGQWNRYLDLYNDRMAAGKPITNAVAGSAPKSPFVPSTSKPKAYMLNVLGSVLGKAMPDSWKAEQIANQHRFNHSWDQLNSEFGYSTQYNDGRPLPAAGTGTYDDYVIAKHEKELDKKGGTNGKPMAPPATKPTLLQKGVAGVGGGVMALTMLPVGTMVGNGVMSLFGFDVDGAVCTQTEGVAQTLASMFTGADCNSWAFDQDFTANEGVVPGLSLRICLPSNATKCIVWTGQYQLDSASTRANVYCMTGNILPSETGAAGNLYIYTTRYPSGTNGTLTNQDFNNWMPTGLCGSVAGTGVGGLWVRGPGITGMTTDVLTGMRFGTTGAVTPVVVEDGNPNRYLTCDVLGDDGIHYTLQTGAFKETDEEIPPVECAALPDGVRPENVQIREDTPGSPSEVLSDQPVTPEYAEWWDEYPECRTGSCKLDLITKLNPTYPVSCFDFDGACAGWFTQADRDSQYECHYGAHVVDLQECYVYSGLFEPGRITTGAPYSDPMTGHWSGGQNAPSPDEQALSQPVQSPNGSRQCNGMAASSFDPVAWVMRPIQCALEWAFVPRPMVVQIEMVKLSTSWDTSFIGQIKGILAPFQALPIYTGCSGLPIYIPFEWPMVFAIDWQFGAACSGPLNVAAQVVRAITAVGLILGGVRAITWYGGGILGYRGFGKQDAS